MNQQQQVHGGGRASRGKSAWRHTVVAQFLLQMQNKKTMVKEMEHNIRKSVIHMANNKIYKKMYTFSASFHHLEILACQIFDLENLGQGRAAQQS